jgi:hypothetical protein
LRPPKLTLACELETEPLVALFSDPQLIDDLLALRATVSLGILNLSAERAGVVRRLNAAGVPVVAWQLLPKDEGYWYNLDNARQAAARYDAFGAWTAEHGLRWAGIGVDIESDFNQVRQLAAGAWREVLPGVVGRVLNGARLHAGQAAYRALIERMNGDGYAVESYQFPLLADERAAGSTLLQRLLGIVDVPVDREVFMLYSSFLGRLGAACLWSYAPEASGAGVGSTGGGVELGATLPVLAWPEFERDLRIAYRRSAEVFVFSLEGCVRQGFLSRLRAFDWDAPALAPEGLDQLEMLRSGLHGLLWATAHPWAVAAGLVAAIGAAGVLSKRQRNQGGKR